MTGDKRLASAAVCPSSSAGSMEEGSKRTPPTSPTRGTLNAAKRPFQRKARLIGS